MYHISIEEWYHYNQSKKDTTGRQLRRSTFLNKLKVEDVEEQMTRTGSTCDVQESPPHPQHKLEGYHAGLAPKWLGPPFQVEHKLGPGV